MALPIKAHNPPIVWTVPEAFRTICSHGTEVAAGFANVVYLRAIRNCSRWSTACRVCGTGHVGHGQC